MAKEIERRFLINKERLPRLVRGKKIIQGYLSENLLVRVRIKDKVKSYLTIKFGEGPIREEFEFKIPLREGESLLRKCSWKIEKTRYDLKLNGDFWEIDIFEGKNKGLCIAEIELKTLASKFQKPLWISKEVTNDSRYLNISLAQNPYKSWQKSLFE